MADLLTYALTDLSSVKESLGIPSANTTKDNLIKRKINQATENIENYCNLARDHHFKQTTYTDEVYQGSGTDQLVLRMRPVTTLTTFERHQSSESSAGYEAVESDLYYLDGNAGTIDLLFADYKNWGQYRVTYIAGYSTIPSDLAEACAMLAAYYVENGTTGSNVKKKQEGRRSIEYFQAQQATSVIAELGIDDSLSRYINYTVGS